MLRHHIPLVPAELLGNYMGLLVPKEENQYFWNVHTGSKPEAGYGTQIHGIETVNTALEKLNIPLKMNWKLIDVFTDKGSYYDYLKGSVNKDVLLCFDWGKLFEQGYQGGHVCVLDIIDLVKKEVRIIDPDYDAPKWRVIKIGKLYEAMMFHGHDNGGGFWELMHVGTKFNTSA